MNLSLDITDIDIIIHTHRKNQVSRKELIMIQLHNYMTTTVTDIKFNTDFKSQQKNCNGIPYVSSQKFKYLISTDKRIKATTVKDILTKFDLQNIINEKEFVIAVNALYSDKSDNDDSNDENEENQVKNNKKGNTNKLNKNLTIYVIEDMLKKKLSENNKNIKLQDVMSCCISKNTAFIEMTNEDLAELCMSGYLITGMTNFHESFSPLKDSAFTISNTHNTTLQPAEYHNVDFTKVNDYNTGATFLNGDKEESAKQCKLLVAPIFSNIVQFNIEKINKKIQFIKSKFISSLDEKELKKCIKQKLISVIKSLTASSVEGIGGDKNTGQTSTGGGRLFHWFSVIRNPEYKHHASECINYINAFVKKNNNIGATEYTILLNLINDIKTQDRLLKMMQERIIIISDSVKDFKDIGIKTITIDEYIEIYFNI